MKVDAGHQWHAHVTEDEVEGLARCEEVERPLRVGRGDHLVGTRERRLHRLAEVVLVVDEEQAPAGSIWRRVLVAPAARGRQVPRQRDAEYASDAER